MQFFWIAAAIFFAVFLMGSILVWATRRRSFATAGQEATFDVLHTANLASPALRSGFSRVALERAAPHLSALIGAPIVSVVNESGVLCYQGEPRHHERDVAAASTETLSRGRSTVTDIRCSDDTCTIKAAVSVPIALRGQVIGALLAFDSEGGPGLIRAMIEVAGWIASQVELAEFDENRDRLARAELRALRAQISPHFIYNALTAIAAFTRTDPERARNLLLEFADFTRYSLSNRGEFTTVAEELRSIERYLTLEQARFGERLQVSLRVAPEVLPVAIPFLVIQPLVENAIRHGIEPRGSVGLVTIVAMQQSNECVITVEDNGVGADPDALSRYLGGDIANGGEHVGLYNVDERLRSVFGPNHGLVIETAPDAGTKVTVRVPKYRPGVRAS
jgi:two-component system, LytTR family, sensor kinase